MVYPEDREPPVAMVKEVSPTTDVQLMFGVVLRIGSTHCQEHRLVRLRVVLKMRHTFMGMFQHGLFRDLTSRTERTTRPVWTSRYDGVFDQIICAISLKFHNEHNDYFHLYFSHVPFVHALK